MDSIVSIIKENINDRKLLLRYKNPVIEKQLSDAGLHVDGYVTRNINRCNNEDCFSDELLNGRSNEFYLLILPELKFNKSDDERYQKFGLKKYKDYIWFYQEYNIDSISVTDEFNNRFDINSHINLGINGINNKVVIGKNVKLNGLRFNLSNNCKIFIEDNVVFKPAYIFMADNTELIIKKNARIENAIVFINSLSVLEIGRNVTVVGGSSRFQTGRNQRIIIGDDCMFSWDITVLGHDGHLLFDVEKKKCINNTVGNIRESIVIGDHVWLGAHASVLPNSYISTGSVIGYGSIVKGFIPNNCIVVGQPARVVKENIAWTRNNVTTDEMRSFEEIPIDYRDITKEY